MTKNAIAMRTKGLLVPIGAVSITLLTGYALFGLAARHPASQSLMSNSKLLPIAPSSILNPQKWSAAFGLARYTLTAPISTDSYMVVGQRYDVPLPSRSFRSSDPIRVYPSGNGLNQQNNSVLRAYITFATPEQLEAYYRKALPEAGWKYVEQMGSTRIYRKNNARLLASTSFYQGTRINQLNLAIELVR